MANTDRHRWPEGCTVAAYNDAPISVESLLSVVRALPVHKPIVGIVCSPSFYAEVQARCAMAGPTAAERIVEAGAVRFYWGGELVEIREKQGQVEPYKAFYDRTAMAVYLSEHNPVV